MYYFLEDVCANSISSPVPEAESSAECFSDIPASVLSRSNLTVAKSCCNGSETESCHDSQSGTTCEHSTANPGADLLTLCAGDFHAPTLVAQEKAQELTESKADYGEKWQGSFARYDHISHSWKTHQCSLFGDWEEFSEIWPNWGLMQDGVVWEVNTLEPAIDDEGYGYWPTLNVRGWRSDGELAMLARLDLTDKELRAFTRTAAGSKKRKYLPTLTICGNYNRVGASETSGDGLYTAIGGKPNPTWEEWFMGMPLGWTQLSPVEMPKFQQWLRSHGAL